MTHRELVNIAKNWLLSAKRCNPVFTERGSAKSNEMPDAIGWNSNESIIVECKMSIGDLRADAKKQVRIKSETGMGKHRYFLFTEVFYSTIPEYELPEGWGIVTVDRHGQGQQVRLKWSKEWEFDINAELYFLRSRIMQIQRFGR